MRIPKQVKVGLLAAATSAMAARVLTKTAEAENPPQGRFLEIGSVRLHYVERGAGEPILYLHGNGAMIQEVAATGLIDRLSARARVIVPDRPGFGWSTRPRGTTWTPERQAEVFAAALARLGTGPVTLIAHSWGTLVALALALAYPEMVRRLVLVGGYYFPEPRADVVLSAPAIPVLGDALRYTVMPFLGLPLAEAIIAKAFAPNRPTESFRREFPLSMALRPSQLRAAAEEIGLMRSSAERLSRRYAGLSVPATLMAGADDRIVTASRHTERLGRVLRTAETHIVPGVGHMLPHILPELVAEAAAAPRLDRTRRAHDLAG